MHRSSISFRYDLVTKLTVVVPIQGSLSLWIPYHLIALGFLRDYVMNEHRKKLERAVNWNIFEIQAALVIATDAKLEEEEKEDKVMLNDDDLQSLQALMKAAAR